MGHKKDCLFCNAGLKPVSVEIGIIDRGEMKWMRISESHYRELQKAWAVEVPQSQPRPTDVKITNLCVCSECGHEQPTMDRCAKCKSVRVVTTKLIEEVFGKDWREKKAIGGNHG